MGKFIDMTGWVMSEHGIPDSRLTVIKRAEDHITSSGNHVIQWECRCSCGKSNTIIVSGISLRTGKTKSCGCLQKEITSNRSFIDLTGQKFNHLTVIKRVEDYMMKNGKRKVRYLCECDCENKTKIIVSAGDLKSGHVKSCGCLKKELGKKKRKENYYEIDSQNNIVKFYFKNKDYFIIDLDDIEIIKPYYWTLDENGYVMSKEHVSGKTIRLHKLLCPNFKEVDHINQNKLDNRKCNFREVTRQENVINRPKSKSNSSGFIGVYWSKKDQSWYSQITFNYRKIHLGYTQTKEEAIIQRLQAELKYFGLEFAPQRHLFKQYGII